nr:MAG TPA: Alternative WD40 repeat motif [Caudoviricetes sp.]
MKPREFRQLHAIPFDIKARTNRIRQLEEKQAEGPEIVADVVKSSRGEGNACIMGHAIVRGTADDAYTRREKEIERLKKINAELEARYLEGQRIVETCEDYLLRAAISDICILGKKPQDVAVEWMEQGYDMDATALRKRVDRWIDQNVR